MIDMETSLYRLDHMLPAPGTIHKTYEGNSAAAHTMTLLLTLSSANAELVCSTFVRLFRCEGVFAIQLRVLVRDSAELTSASPQSCI